MVSDKDFNELVKIVQGVCKESARAANASHVVADDLAVVIGAVTQILARNHPMLLREFQEKLMNNQKKDPTE